MAATGESSTLFVEPGYTEPAVVNGSTPEAHANKSTGDEVVCGPETQEEFNARISALDEKIKASCEDRGTAKMF